MYTHRRPVTCGCTTTNTKIREWGRHRWALPNVCLQSSSKSCLAESPSNSEALHSSHDQDSPKPCAPNVIICSSNADLRICLVDCPKTLPCRSFPKLPIADHSRLTSWFRKLFTDQAAAAEKIARAAHKAACGKRKRQSLC